MIWFVALAAVVLLILSLYGARRRAPAAAPKQGRRPGRMEASTEIGIPPEEVDPERALRADRLAGVRRPRVGGSRSPGSLKQANLRKDRISKEVELAWEAGDAIELQTGAYARRGSGAFREEDYSLPEKYGVDRLVLMARDPEWVYAYWEIAHAKYKHIMEGRVAEWNLSRPALRLYDITGRLRPAAHMDIVVGENSDNWYIYVDRPQHTLVAELGRLFEGEFVPFLRSNPVTLPPRTYSMEISGEWADFNWERLYGRFVPRRAAASPLRWGR